MFFLNSGTAEVDDGLSRPVVVLGVFKETVFEGEDHIEIEHYEELELRQGTFALRFTADDAVKKQGLFSKDFTGNRDGGDLTALVEQGRVSVRFQSASEEVWAKTPKGSVHSYTWCTAMKTTSSWERFFSSPETPPCRDSSSLRPRYSQ